MIHSPVHKSSISTGYVDAILGTRIFSNNSFQINTLGHLDYLQYKITGLPAPYGALVSNEKQYYRGWTVGAGVSLQLQIRLIKTADYDWSLGIEPGILAIVNQPTWEYGHKGYSTSSSSTSHKHFYGISVDGPDVSKQLTYLKISFILRV